MHLPRVRSRLLLTLLIVSVLSVSLLVFALYWFGPPYPPHYSSAGPRVGAEPFQTAFPPANDWSPQILTQAEQYVQDVGVDALVVLHEGKLVIEWGKTDRVTNLHSARKSVLSLLIGIAVDRGLLDLEQTLEQLGIGDMVGLTTGEKEVRIRDLLTCRSGVYLPAVGEVSSMKELRPNREEYAPGEYWYYNNWDFNALGVIFEQQIGISIGRAIEEWLAVPLGMEDFRPEHVFYWESRGTEHRMYRMSMSARDMARIGQLVADGGLWHGKQIVSADWIAKSTRAICKTHPRNNCYYGYSWWVPWSGQVQANGLGGQIIQIDTQLDLVIVTKNFSGSNIFTGAWWMMFGDRMEASDLRELIRLVKEAGGIGQSDPTFASLVEAGDIAAAITHFRTIIEQNPGAFFFTEMQLNRMAYDVLNSGDVDGAIELFRLNVELFPDFANTHDSFGEALLAKGEVEAARHEYLLALELDPWSPSARAALAELENGNSETGPSSDL